MIAQLHLKLEPAPAYATDAAFHVRVYSEEMRAQVGRPVEAFGADAALVRFGVAVNAALVTFQVALLTETLTAEVTPEWLLSKCGSAAIGRNR
jgi:hypothetical protein